MNNSIRPWALGLFFLFFVVTAHSVGAGELLNKGDVAPEFPTGVQWVGGSGVKLADLQGKKAVLLYFLKTGCGSCDEFAPHLYRLALTHKDSLQVVGITGSPKAEVEEYAAKRVGDYPLAVFPNFEFIQRFIGKITQFPYIVLIGKDGKIAWYGRGKFHAQVSEEVERQVAGAADADAPAAKGKRYALVVAAPEGLKPLAAPEKEGAAVASALKKAGYAEVVGLGSGLGAAVTAGNLKKSLNDLLTKADKDDMVLFYFAGDAKQANLGQTDYELLLEGGELALSDLYGAVAGVASGKNMLWTIDANQSDSGLEEWEDVSQRVAQGLPGVTLLLAASRWDRSNVLKDDPAGTIFAKLFCAALAGPVGARKVYDFWRDLRDTMNDWSRQTGTLQSPFIENAGDFSLLPGKSE